VALAPYVTADVNIPQGHQADGLAYLSAFATASDTILAALGAVHYPPRPPGRRRLLRLLDTRRPATLAL
jgi:hypothetical protein